jgi:RimJ/RimL family protein N-acetyltransferase
MSQRDKIILATDRLALREFTPADAEFLMELVVTPGWLEFIGDKNFQTAADAIQFIESVLISSYNKFGFGSWLVELKNTKQPIGLCGLVKRDSLENVDLGFALLPNYTKLGYGYEIASATLKHAHDKLKIDHVVAITDAHNTSSINLLNKLGMTFKSNITLPVDDHVMLFSS